MNKLIADRLSLVDIDCSSQAIERDGLRSLRP
jgi:hypothetical protein